MQAVRFLNPFRQETRQARARLIGEHLPVCPLTRLLLFTQILPGVRIIIANPETKGPLGDSHLGEVSSRRLTPGARGVQGRSGFRGGVSLRDYERSPARCEKVKAECVWPRRLPSSQLLVISHVPAFWRRSLDRNRTERTGEWRETQSRSRSWSSSRRAGAQQWLVRKSPAPPPPCPTPPCPGQLWLLRPDPARRQGCQPPPSPVLAGFTPPICLPPFSAPRTISGPSWPQGPSCLAARCVVRLPLTQTYSNRTQNAAVAVACLERQPHRLLVWPLEGVKSGEDKSLNPLPSWAVLAPPPHCVKQSDRILYTRNLGLP